MTPLERSYAYCRAVAKRRARNFYYSFVLLPPEKKNAMCAIYAFMRYCDDLSDEPGATRTAMDRWRQALTDALAGRPDDNPAWPAFLDAVKRYAIPHEYFYEMIEGVASDLEPRTIATFDGAVSVLLSRSVGGRTHDRSIFSDLNRLKQGSGAPAGREVRDCFPADEYPARCSGRCGARAHLYSGGGSACGLAYRLTT